MTIMAIQNTSSNRTTMPENWTSTVSATHRIQKLLIDTKEKNKKQKQKRQTMHQ